MTIERRNRMNGYADRAHLPDVQLVIPGSGTPERKSNRCCVCHRMLRREPHVQWGIGPVCASKHPDVLSELQARHAHAAQEFRP
jgi:hypothetical protein